MVDVPTSVATIQSLNCFAPAPRVGAFLLSAYFTLLRLNSLGFFPRLVTPDDMVTPGNPNRGNLVTVTEHRDRYL